MREREHQGARGRREEQARVHAARAEAVEQDAHRDLAGGKGEEVGAGEQPQVGRRKAELGDQVRRDDRIDAAVDVGKEVRERERQHDRACRARGQRARLRLRAAHRIRRIVTLLLPRSALRMKLNTDTNSATKNPAQKPVTMKPGTSQAVSRSMSALITSAKMPSVTMVSGR